MSIFFLSIPHTHVTRDKRDRISDITSDILFGTYKKYPSY